eukprot:2213643-Rhodomonas_salina.3
MEPTNTQSDRAQNQGIGTHSRVWRYSFSQPVVARRSRRTVTAVMQTRSISTADIYGPTTKFVQRFGPISVTANTSVLPRRLLQWQ